MLKASFEGAEADEELLKLFSFGALGNLSPMQAVLGGIAAQEVLKVGSHVVVVS